MKHLQATRSATMRKQVRQSTIVIRSWKLPRHRIRQYKGPMGRIAADLLFNAWKCRIGRAGQLMLAALIWRKFQLGLEDAGITLSGLDDEILNP